MQIETPLGFPCAGGDAVELPADARLRVFRQCNFTPEDMQDWRFAPVIGIAEIQVERPVPAQLRARFDLDNSASLGLAVNTGSKPVGALTFDGSKDGNGADDVVAAAIKRHRAPVDKAVDAPIGSDPEHENAPVHAADAFIDGGEPSWNVVLDRRCDRRQSKFDCRGNPRGGRKRGRLIGDHRRLLARGCRYGKAASAKQDQANTAQMISRRSMITSHFLFPCCSVSGRSLCQVYQPLRAALPAMPINLFRCA